MFQIRSTVVHMGRLANKALEIRVPLVPVSLALRNMCASRFVEINVATELSYEGHFKQAQSLLESSLRDSMSTNGPMDAKTISLERNIASLLIEQGNIAQAEEICLRAVQSVSQLKDAPGHSAGTISETEAGSSSKRAIEMEVSGFKALLGSIHLEHRRYTEAEALFREAIAEQEALAALREGAKASEGVLTSYTNLGRALMGLDRFDESEGVLRTNLADFVAKYGRYGGADSDLVPLTNSGDSAPPAVERYSVGTLRCMDALATCLMLKPSTVETEVSSNMAEAEELFRSIVRSYASHPKYGEKHRLTLRASANLGTFLESRGEDRWEEAEGLLTATLEAQKVALGGLHPDTLITMSYLGELYDNYGFAEEALLLWRGAMEAHVEAYGHEHVDTLRAKQHYAGLLVNGDDFSAANALLLQVVTAREAALGETHTDTVGARKALAETFYGMDMLPEAEAHYERCLEALAGSAAEDALFEALLIKGSLGLLHMGLSVPATGGLKLQREEKAYTLLHESCEGLRALVGENDLHFLRALGNVATFFLSASPASDTSVTPPAVDVSKLGYGSSAAGVDTANALEAACETGTGVLSGRRDLLLAEQHLRVVIKGMTEMLGPQHDYTVGYTSNLAMLLFNEQRSFKEAADLFRVVCQAFITKFGYEHAKTLIVLYPLSICLAYSGQIDEATHCAVMYCQHCKALHGEHSPELQAGLNILDQLRNYKITPSSDTTELRTVHGTNDVDEDIHVRSRADPDDLVEVEDGEIGEEYLGAGTDTDERP